MSIKGIRFYLYLSRKKRVFLIDYMLIAEFDFDARII